MSAKQRYDFLTGDRNQYLTVARRASDLTLPYLIRDDDDFTKFRKKNMLAYRFRPNPLNNPRRAYY